MSIKSLIRAIVLVFGVTVGLDAQTAIPGSRLTWDQAAPTLAEAQGYTYTYYPEAAPPAVILTAVTCSGTASPFTCVVAFPAFTPGAHTLQLTASNIAGESTRSAAFAFTFVVVPGAPANIRIQ